MLKKILIAVAVVLVIAMSVGGYEAWSLYNGASGILGFHNPAGPNCKQPPLHSASGLPSLLPWEAAQAKAAPTPTSAGKKLIACIDPGSQESSLNGDHRINILVLGSDTDCKFEQYLTQTVFVVTIDPVHKTVGMLSIPRDSWLPIPGSILGDSYTYAKMDQAFAAGEEAAGSTNGTKEFQNGALYAESTISQNFGIPIKLWAWVGLDGFVKVINTLHGVDLNAIHPIEDDQYPGDKLQGGCNGFTRVFIPAGPQAMDGSTALQYVRSRHSDLIGDFGRGQRQLQTMVALRPKIETLGLTDFFTVKSLLSDLAGFVKSDIGVNAVGSYVSFAKNLKISQIKKLVLTPPKYSSTAAIDTPEGVQDVVNLNWNAVNPAVAKMFAPIKSGKHKTPHKHHPKFVSTTEASAYLSRVSGAVPQPPSRPTPQFSGPLNGSIYYVAGGNVYRYNSSGTTQITHTTAISGASITGNGRVLAYYRRWSQNNADIWLKNLQNGRSKQITFSHNGDGYLSNTVDCVDYPFCGYVWNVNPVIAPNGKSLVYSSDAYKDLDESPLNYNLDCATSPANNGIDLAIYRYDVASGSATMETAPCWEAGGDVDARFNPANPNEIVYTEYYYVQDTSNIASRLIVLNPTTGKRWRITGYHGRNMQAAWSPNGTRLAWIGSSDQSTTLYEAKYSKGRLVTGTRKVLDTGLVAEPEFSPDGKHLVYFKLVGSDFQMWIINLHNGWPVGQPMRLITPSNLTTTSAPDWIK